MISSPTLPLRLRPVDIRSFEIFSALNKLTTADRSRFPLKPLMSIQGSAGDTVATLTGSAHRASGERRAAGCAFPQTHLEPLGMSDTSFVISPAQQAREASGHHRQPDAVDPKAEPIEHLSKQSPPPRSFTSGSGVSF